MCVFFFGGGGIILDVLFFCLSLRLEYAGY